MKTVHSSPKSAAAVAVATPCWPAPVSAIRRRFPIRFVRRPLADHVVELVRARVQEVLTLQQYLDAELAAQSLTGRDRRGAAAEVGEHRRRTAHGRRGLTRRRGRRRRAPRTQGPGPRARSCPPNSPNRPVVDGSIKESTGRALPSYARQSKGLVGLLVARSGCPAARAAAMNAATFRGSFYAGRGLDARRDVDAKGRDPVDRLGRRSSGSSPPAEDEPAGAAPALRHRKSKSCPHPGDGAVDHDDGPPRSRLPPSRPGLPAGNALIPCRRVAHVGQVAGDSWPCSWAPVSPAGSRCRPRAGVPRRGTRRSTSSPRQALHDVGDL